MITPERRAKQLQVERFTKNHKLKLKNAYYIKGYEYTFSSS